MIRKITFILAALISVSTYSQNAIEINEQSKTFIQSQELDKAVPLLKPNLFLERLHLYKPFLFFTIIISLLSFTSHSDQFEVSKNHEQFILLKD